MRTTGDWFGFVSHWLESDASFGGQSQNEVMRN